MKKKIDCDCGRAFKADGFKIGFAVLYAGSCPACEKTYTCLSGTPGQVMAQSLLLADNYMDCAFQSAKVLGIHDPCVLDPEEIMRIAQA